jgi:hypothetical protein
MRLLTIALALSTSYLSGCTRPEVPRAIAVTPDPAKLTDCPTTFPAAPTLPPLASFALPDGRVVVLLSTIIARETKTVDFILLGRASWHACQSSVAYVQDWTKGMAGK